MRTQGDGGSEKGHIYYRCTKSRGVKKCLQRYTREETLEKALGEEIAKIRLDDEVLDLIVDASKKLASKTNQGKEFFGNGVIA